ncbi:translocation/assembly module TamB domain-containing protein [Wenzhouxiangella marina]|uniref:Translocation and assembly module TamB C-terminal domain-containing protein n=1 Tax=Wenzhouxiangella marina TaxID=1579979 RepID=A0A0K0XZL6_9GAMM|nr:translocation/assembly module TamB domain-containing protein [Wenzhouxiangella marina]AKS43082.1 hypothetical protein WM2015_2724 [Wenzhouxiangella marina]MBB6087234.1 translocation and assembly module TamB [Wenzhouxiangella marina]
MTAKRDTAKPAASQSGRPRRRWPRRLALGLLLGLSLILLAASGGLYWLTRTEAGARFALGQAQGAVPGLAWAGAEGNLRDGLRLTGFVFEQAGTRVAAGQVVLAARLRLFGGMQLRIEGLTVSDLDIELPPPDEQDEPPSPIELPDLSSPIPVIVESIRIQNAALRAHGDTDALLRLDTLELAGEYFDELRIERFTAELLEGTIGLRGQAELAPPHRLGLQLDAEARLPEQPAHRLGLRIDGPLDRLRFDLTSEGPLSLSGPIEVRGLPGLPSASLELVGHLGDWPGLAYSVPELALSASGSMGDWQARLDTRIEGPELPDNRIAIDARGDATEARLDALRVETLDGLILASGRIGWIDALSAELTVTLDQLDFSSRYPELPAQARLNGALSLSLADQAIRLDSLALQAPPTTLSVLGSGRYDPASDDLALDLIWQDFNWPPVSNGEPALISSERGEARLSGRLSDWRAELEALLQLPDQPQASIEARLQGDLDSAVVETLDFDAAGAGRARLDGAFSWQDGLRGQAAAQLIDLDPSEFIQQLPGRVSGRFDLTLASAEDFTLAIEELGGTLRGQALSGEGRIRWRAQAPQAGRLTLALGENDIELDSADGERWAFTARGNALGQLWPGLSGVLEASGEILPATGELSLNGRVRDGGLHDVTLRELDLDAELRWQAPTHANVRLVLQDLDLNPWERIEQLELNLNGRCRAHRFDLGFSAQRASLDLAGQGQWPECFRGGQRWDAAIERLFIGDTLAGDWQLDQVLRLVMENRIVDIEPACLAAAGPEPGQLCLESARLAPTGEASRARIRLAEVPLDLLLLPLDPTVSLSSQLAGELEAGWTLGAGLDRLGGQLNVDAGVITPLGAEAALLSIDGARLDLQPSNGGVLARFETRFEGQSQLNATIGIDDLRDPGQSTLNGELALELPDIGVFNRALSEFDELHGRLEGRMALRGRLAAPELDGQARLIDGAVRHAPLGLDVRNIELNIDGSQTRARLAGRMESGEGALDLTGELRGEAGQWAWSLNGQGQRFQVASAEWLELSISPDLTLSGRGSDLSIDGQVDIDRLLAGLPPGRESRITASEDVIVLGQTDPEARASGLVMSGRLGIDLGEDARLNAAGLETRLTGEVELLWDEAAALPRARGIIRLPEGSFEAYGQNLEIEDGEIILSNQPITNPRLDIAAVREIFGDPQVEQAGVSIRGPAQSPDIKLFTEPPTSEEKALAYVVTGADFDHAGGQGAVNVGLYLLPRLFVSYGIGLFESGNVLSGRYELSRRWGVRVVSGQRDTGVDLSYAIDR